MDDEKRLARNAYMREWKRNNKDKVNVINAAVKAKKPELYKTINRLSAAKRYKENPEKFKEVQRSYRKENQELCQQRTKAWAKARPGIYLFYNAKQRAKKFNLPFDIEPSDVVIPTVCPAIGIPIEATVQGRRGFHPNSPSIDRVVPELGYVKGNICVISNKANWIKRDATAAELRAIADYVERLTGWPSATPNPSPLSL